MTPLFGDMKADAARVRLNQRMYPRSLSPERQITSCTRKCSSWCEIGPCQKSLPWVPAAAFGTRFSITEQEAMRMDQSEQISVRVSRGPQSSEKGMSFLPPDCFLTSRCADFHLRLSSAVLSFAASGSG